MAEKSNESAIKQLLDDDHNDLHVFKILIDNKYPVSENDSHQFLHIYNQVKSAYESSNAAAFGWFSAVSVLYASHKLKICRNAWLCPIAFATWLFGTHVYKQFSVGAQETYFKNDIREITAKYNWKHDPNAVSILKRALR